MENGTVHFLYDARREDAPEDYHNYWCACRMSFGDDMEAALVHLQFASPQAELHVSYKLEHTADQIPNGPWFFAKDLGSDRDKAMAELTRKRALAEGSETHVLYRVSRHTEEVLPW